MKKTITILLIIMLALSFTACGGGKSGGASKKDFPLTYTPQWYTKDVKGENNPDGNASLAHGYSNVAYDTTVEITIEYCKAEDELYTAINGESDWPTELNEEWEGYGYTAIETTEEASKRTLAVGQYGDKQVTVLRQHEELFGGTTFVPSQEALSWPEDETLLTVPYCMIEAAGEVTIEQIALAAHEALYLQAWSLVPAANQGVLVNANGKTYTVDDILSELAK